MAPQVPFRGPRRTRWAGQHPLVWAAKGAGIALVTVTVLAFVLGYSINVKFGPSPETTLCAAATSLASGEARIREALRKEEDGDAKAAHELARQAKALADQGYGHLQAIESGDVHRTSTWQGLLTTSMHVGQVSLGVLPGYSENDAGLNAEGMAMADERLRLAREGLAAECFAAEASAPPFRATPDPAL